MFQKEMDLINRALFEIFIEGDGHGRPFTFPIPTINVSKDFNWDNPVLEPVWEATAKYGVPYFANYINSDLKPEDACSMCCRLRLSTKELKNKGGGLFGATRSRDRLELLPSIYLGLGILQKASCNLKYSMTLWIKHETV